MGNTYINISMVTRECLMTLHEMLTFCGTINRQYDNRFAKKGAKIGTQLQIRLPNKYSVRTGKTMQAQESVEQTVTLTLATQKGVDMDGFSSSDMTIKVIDFHSHI